MSKSNFPRIIVVGNETQGVGKTTLSMHLISALLDHGLKVSSIDIDSKNQSLTNYIHNRQNAKWEVLIPNHFLLEEQEQKAFEDVLAKSSSCSDIVVIDIPGSVSLLSKLIYSYADIVITPINDNLKDLEIIGKMDKSGQNISPSLYSQMIWEQKMTRAKRDGNSIEWFVTRNLLGHLDVKNKLKENAALDNLSKRMGFKIVRGFKKRDIFEELFHQGLTITDITKIEYDKPLNLSQIAARQELRDFFKSIYH